MALLTLYQRIVVGSVVFFALTIYGINHNSYCYSPRQSEQEGSATRKNAVRDFKRVADPSSEQEVSLSSRAISRPVAEINRQINRRTLKHNKGNRYMYNKVKIRAYLRTLPPLQVRELIKEVGVSNLTSETSQKQFLNCSGIEILGGSLQTPIHIPPSHQHCKKMRFQSSGPIVALGSFAGSGNSWVRQLLESATGIYTGAIYCDPSYIAAGMIGEGITTENVLAIKCHASPSTTKSLLNHDKVIYIVRSPFGAIISEENRRHTKQLGLDKRHTSEIHFNKGLHMLIVCV